jgi:hypothetical protein
MQGVVSKSVVATATIVSLALVASIASARSHSAQKTATVEVTETAQIPNGPTLAPGSYKVAVLGDSATAQVGFYQNGKLVGQAPAEVVDQNEKSPVTGVYLDSSGGSTVVTEIHIGGWTKKIEFMQAAGESASGQ